MFSHIDSGDRPMMVDVGDKSATKRKAHAQGIVRLPKALLNEFDGKDLASKKGPVFQTAIIAGTLAAKKTSDLIPFCHPLFIDDCQITMTLKSDRLMIDCYVSTHGKTGVEMESLTGVSAAALTVYDMCKSVSKDIVIESIQLISKTGGKTDFSVVDQRLMGLVLMGGKSRRMGLDKSKMDYHGKEQWQHCRELLRPFCDPVFLSVNPDQAKAFEKEKIIIDDEKDMGPLGGIISAMRAYPSAAFLVLAIDMPFVTLQTLQQLVTERQRESQATAFLNPEKNWAEPLCAIYEPSIFPFLLECVERSLFCPRKILSQSKTALITAKDPKWLSNVNALKKVQVSYFGLLKEQRGLGSEVCETHELIAKKLYESLQKKHAFTLDFPFVRVAVNDQIKEWDAEINEGDRIAFLPPMSGG